MVKPLQALVSDANYLAAVHLSHAIEVSGSRQVGQPKQAFNQLSVNLRNKSNAE
jgi:nitrogen fixation/metabolism regulation signal transduction histidine kinase